MATLAEIAVVLETTEKNVIRRLRYMRMLPVCNRCGGSGRYSFNGEHSRCYGCEGSGVRAPKASELDAILIDAKASKSDGRFEDYKRYLAATAIVKNGAASVMNAWRDSGVSKAYDWRSSYSTSPTYNPRDGMIAAINEKMHDAYTSVQHPDFNPASPTYTADVLAYAAKVAAALETIEAARLELVAAIG